MTVLYVSIPSTVVGVVDENKAGEARSHLQTLIIYTLRSNQNNYTIALMLLMKIVLCSKFP